MKQLQSKLRARRGASLTEMLVTVMILGLVSLAVSVGISAALPVYRDSVALSESAVLTSTLAQAMGDELRYARALKTDAAGNLLSYNSANYGVNAQIGNTDGQITVSGKPLIGSGAYTGFSAVASASAAPGDPSLLTIRLEVQKNSAAPVQTTEFQIRLVNDN